MPYATNGAIRIHYEVEGSGEPLLLHHGFTDTLDSWHEHGWVDALRERYRLVLVDGRGHGESDRPIDAAEYALDRRLGDALAVLDALGIARARWAGYSMGGWLGLATAAFAPARVIRVAAGGAHPFAERLETLRQGVAGGMERWVTLVERARGAPLHPAQRARLLAADPRVLTACALDREDILEPLSRARVPVLLFAGSEDPRRAPCERAAALLPSARCEIIEGYDHLQLGLRLELALPRVRSFLEAGDLASGQHAPRP